MAACDYCELVEHPIGCTDETMDSPLAACQYDNLGEYKKALKRINIHYDALKQEMLFQDDCDMDEDYNDPDA